MNSDVDLIKYPNSNYRNRKRNNGESNTTDLNARLLKRDYIPSLRVCLHYFQLSTGQAYEDGTLTAGLACIELACDHVCEIYSKC